MKEEIKETTLPIFACQHCGKRSEINFNPTKERKRWDDFVCPFCKKRRLEIQFKEIFED